MMILIIYFVSLCNAVALINISNYLISSFPYQYKIIDVNSLLLFVVILLGLILAIFGMANIRLWSTLLLFIIFSYTLYDIMYGNTFISKFLKINKERIENDNIQVRFALIRIPNNILFYIPYILVILIFCLVLLYLSSNRVNILLIGLYFFDLNFFECFKKKYNTYILISIIVVLFIINLSVNNIIYLIYLFTGSFISIFVIEHIILNNKMKNSLKYHNLDHSSCNYVLNLQNYTLDLVLKIFLQNLTLIWTRTFKIYLSTISLITLMYMVYIYKRRVNIV